MRKIVAIGLAIAATLAGPLGCLGPAASRATLRIAVLPVLDSLPFYVAEAEEFYDEEGITVELVAVSSAAERDQLLQAGQVDMLITDLVALELANREQIQIVAVRYAMVPTDTYAQFRVLAAPGTAFETVRDLAGISIGVSEGTVIEYVTDRLLTAEGLPSDQIETVAVPRIPDRMSLLGAGELPAATLPEPLATLAMQQGARVIIDDTSHREYSCSIVAVRPELLDTQPMTVRRLLRALDRAIAAINADKKAWSGLLSEKQLVPPALGADYSLPDYPNSAVPPETQVADAAAWLSDKGLLDEPPAYAQIVNADFLR
ncbi:MAG: ABC transporter substrate-binding protein [Anaerolineae bacterium]|nr:ABC transporter substrate-binding protein [Anaerolineae bacterium]